MAVRKSKLIGSIISGYKVLDSKHEGRDTKLFIECLSCKSQFWKSRGFLKNGGKCPECSNGRNFRNAKGFTDERLYKRYRIILRRIKDPNKYQGVTMCKEWEDDYQAFRKWALSHGYKDNLTIDRIDNSKGYEPENCRWVTERQQANNRSSNRIVIYNNTKYTVSELAVSIKLPYTTVLQRVENGWNIEDVVKTPYKSRKKWSELNES